MCDKQEGKGGVRVDAEEDDLLHEQIDDRSANITKSSKLCDRRK